MDYCVDDLLKNIEIGGQKLSTISCVKRSNKFELKKNISLEENLLNH